MTFGKFWRINAVVITVLIAVVSLTPETDDLQPAMSLTAWLARLVFSDPESGDKIAHFLAYGAMGLFATLGWGRKMRDLAVIAGFVVTYGLLLELLQLIGGARTGDILDLLANSLGGVTGITGALILRHLVVRFWPSLQGTVTP